MAQDFQDYGTSQRICAHCGARTEPGAAFCGSCGTATSTVEAAGPASAGSAAGIVRTAGPVTLEFTGTAMQALGWGLLYILLTILVIPAGWGVAALARWYVRNLSFSDGTHSHFEGRGGDIWYYFLLPALVQFIPFLGFLMAPFVTIWVYLVILRWFFENTGEDRAGNLRFDGTYWPLFGWYFLWVFSFLSIIGWAWVQSAMMRWICRNIYAGQDKVEFVASGWDFLWRGFALLGGSILIITIPYIWAWYIRWFTRSIVIQRAAA